MIRDRLANLSRNTFVYLGRTCSLSADPRPWEDGIQNQSKERPCIHDGHLSSTLDSAWNGTPQRSNFAKNRSRRPTTSVVTPNASSMVTSPSRRRLRINRGYIIGSRTPSQFGTFASVAQTRGIGMRHGNILPEALVGW